MKKHLRLILTIALVVITISAFAYYISGHEDLITQLGHIPKSTVVWLLLLYTLWFGALGLILWASILICKKILGLKENFLVNAFSTLFNFFIPGQGGIALRGVYFKKTKNLLVRNYIFVSLIYFMFYALISIGMLLAPSEPIWLTALAIVVVGGISSGVIYFYKRKSKTSSDTLDLSFKLVGYLFLATLFQAIIQIAIYGVELHSVNPNIALHQMIIYTGAANFALFVALTPGAIGIRESFLLLSRHLHGIDSANIISANIIDRSVFLVLLGIIFVLTISLHANYKNYLNKTDTKPAKSEI